ncbi:hypothetical protein O181_012692 [Austropuccinia psidii MF-1]|uniref:Integrase catalytic domain-containing protein n=1 Tax=Austropuccinia psidii MF-1 TaxID=1389203 RepID=A0A9Q3GN92_9BASI|nr:hypothetical protein [Austropuccinia psidii MF-1]
MSTFLKTKHVICSLKEEDFEVIKQNGNQVFSGSLSTGNRILHKHLKKAFFSTRIPNSIVMLYKSPSHLSLEYFRKIYPERQTPNLKCVTCSTSKMNKAPFKGTFPIATLKFQYLHLDLCGPISTLSVSGEIYFLKVLDGFSHFAWAFFIPTKSDIKEILKKHIVKIERQENCSFQYDF